MAQLPLAVSDGADDADGEGMGSVAVEGELAREVWMDGPSARASEGEKGLTVGRTETFVPCLHGGVVTRWRVISRHDDPATATRQS